MNSLKVSTRLTILIGVLCALLLAIGSLGLYGISKSNDALKSVYEDRTVPTGQLGDIALLMLHNRTGINIALVTPTPEVIKHRTEEVEANIGKIATLLGAYITTTRTPEADKLANSFVEAHTKFVQEGLVPAVAALRANNLKEAERVATGPLKAGYDEAGARIQEMVQMQVDEAQKEYAAALARYVTIRVVSIVAIAGGVLFGGLLGFVLVRTLGRQLGAEPGDAAGLAQSVAAGDLGVPIALRPGDTSSLMAQLKEMQNSLVRVVSNVRQNAESVATASAQIAQGNNDLSSRTEQQASALEETAASMEQLSSTVRQNADNAKQANQLALGASTVAVKGGEVVGQVVETMKEINESSKRIADIIGVIDGIAFQTNILALNAAVEAARAGDQGRGFAVVASEVRNLAGRSAEAAKEIKRLISASVERVEQGTALVGEAGATMTEVVASIRRVTDIMGEISAASGEQSAGVAQVGEAVTQMDRATQQNAALVEESAAAAESLKQQAKQLVQAVAVFNLAQGYTAAATVRAETSASATPSAVSADNAERRGPDRAKNVTRPKFGSKATTDPAAPKHRTSAASRRSGTDDDWTSF